MGGPEYTSMPAPVIQREVLQFLSELKLNNHREWFEAHRDTYQRARQQMNDFCDSPAESSKITALKSMGKYPQQWIDRLSEYLDAEQPKPILMEAISSSFSSNSKKLASKIEPLLQSKDADVLAYSMLTLANIHQTENLGDLLQLFSMNENVTVRNAAKEAIVIYSQKGFDDYMTNEIGFEE